MSASVTTVAKAIEAVERLYEFREPEKVRAFLAKNPDLIDLVTEAAAKIPEFLLPEARIVLEVVADPEGEGGEGDELFALVPTRMPWEGVRPRYHRLVREWLIFTPERIAGRFNVGPEYR
jgi:hypothetical protein